MKTPEQLDYDYQHQMMDHEFDGPAFFAEAGKEALRQFMELVRDMRRLQTAYFATRDKGILITSKIREKEVDEAIRRFWLPECVVDAEPKDDHPKLF
jgi:hypothetical protein